VTYVILSRSTIDVQPVAHSALQPPRHPPPACARVDSTTIEAPHCAAHNEIPPPAQQQRAPRCPPPAPGLPAVAAAPVTVVCTAPNFTQNPSRRRDPRICSHGPDIFHVQRRKCTGGMRWCAALAVLALTGSSVTVDAHPGCIHSQKAIRSKPLIIRCAPDSLHVCVSIFQLDRPNAAPSRALFGLCAPTELRRRTSRHFQTGGQQVISSPFASGSTFR
jgi:hypothetical protein